MARRLETMPEPGGVGVVFEREGLAAAFEVVQAAQGRAGWDGGGGGRFGRRG